MKEPSILFGIGIDDGKGGFGGIDGLSLDFKSMYESAASYDHKGKKIVLVAFIEGYELPVDVDLLA